MKIKQPSTQVACTAKHWLAATNVVFTDDFSGTLSQWSKSYCDAWISSGEVDVKGNTSGYYGTLYHSFSSYVAPLYTVNMKLARVSSATSEDYYGLLTKVNDTGSPAITSFWFTILPGSSGQNWALLAFVSAGTSSRWALLASDSKGYSSLIRTGENQWNDISYTIEIDKTVIVKIGNTLLYQSDEIGAIENDFGITITMSLTQVGIRTVEFFEVKGDDVQVAKPGGFFASSWENEIQQSSLDDEAHGNIMQLRPDQHSHLPTLAEALRSLLKR